MSDRRCPKATCGAMTSGNVCWKCGGWVPPDLEQTDPIVKIRRQLREIINKAPEESICKIRDFVKHL